MYNDCVVAVYKDRGAARLAVHILHRSDLPTERVSLIASHPDLTPDQIREIDFGDESIHDGFLGAGLGGVAGFLVGAMIAAFTGPGVILVAGPLAGLLTGAGAGALLGSMEGWGIHHSHLEHYEQLLKQGHALVIVDGDPLLVGEADRLLEMTDVEELHRHSRAGEDSPEIVEQETL